MNELKGKKILITGGTGSLGQALTKRLLKSEVDVIRIFSRNENKQVMMQSELNDDRLRYLIGDIRDAPRLQRALEDIDIVFHAAALKHVPVVEYNPFEAINTNVIGSRNVIEACLHEDVEIAVGVGTDKAVSPLNTYGATKLLMEKLFVTASNYLDKKRHKTKFIALRYGNVLGSSGSVIPKFIQQIKSKQKLTITSPEMTRFSITMEEALDFILSSTFAGKGSEIFVPKLKAYTIETVKESLQELLGNTGEEKIPVRQGEKYHETLINADELRNTLEGNTRYMILQRSLSDDEIRQKYPNMKRTALTESYSSDKVELIKKDTLKELIGKSDLL
ncbi:SDR family NAD(P)-dependent oxidoreductase [Nitrosarchaeum koreense]|uniref:Polysaccharide biosynthesis protein CapD n=1 Tax=Nitrosarchaeum koreense MY1 TaxID=1001994 RepID=F9CYB2_9ARCH|nr:SDR family NAD(P)-dependent oxidoreductase [Nitrosarchaeum koreense]EGP92890.1 Polysaccharide biosynthesis protein CapD [Nitrosarchaeum koreense MY1]